MINLTSSQLRKAADLQDQIVKLQTQLAGILVNPSTWIPETIKVSKPAKKGMSAAGISKIAAAQKARWAKIKAAKASPKAAVKPVAKAKPVQKKKRKMSAAGRARIVAAQKARWAKVNAAKAAPKAAVKQVAKVVVAKPVKKTRKISAEGIARIKAAQKARWAAIKAAKK